MNRKHQATLNALSGTFKCAKWFVRWISAGVVACSALIGTGQSFAESDAECARAEMVQRYRAYRAANARIIDRTQRLAVHWESDQRLRVLVVTPLQISHERLSCLADEGDQLALLLRGHNSLMFPRNAMDFANGLRDVARAAEATDSTAIETCRDIDARGTYECGAGLPEAHALLASLFAGCKSSVWRPDLAAVHLELARRAWVYQVNFVSTMVVDQQRRPQECVTFRPHRLVQFDE